MTQEPEIIEPLPSEPGQPGEDQPAERGFTGNLFGFILAPALMAMVAVGIGYTFYYLTYDRRSQMDYATLLRSERKTDRWQAALDLVDTNRGSPDLVPILIEMVDSSDESQMLAQKGWETGDLLKTTAERQINLRWFATAALGKIGGPNAYEKLLKLTSDKDDGVRMFAVQSLARIRNPESAPLIMELLINDKDWGVRAASAFALGELGDPKAIPALKKALETDANDDTKLNSAIALARLGDGSGKTRLEEGLKGPDAAIRQEARKALRLIEETEKKK